jgi:hypothetical protein
VVQSQPGQIVLGDPILTKPITKRAGGEVQGVGPEFKSQYSKNSPVPPKNKNQSKMDQRCGSSDRAALQAGSPEFKPQSQQKN